MKNLQANEPQSRGAENARRNPEYRKIVVKVRRLWRQLEQSKGTTREAIIKELTKLERQQRDTPYYAKEKRHPSQVGYARYADDFVIVVQGKKPEAQAIQDDIGKKLQEMGLSLSEEKTKLTHWRHKVNRLGYQLHGRPTRKGTSIAPVLSIPREKVQKIKDAIRLVGSYHHIPEADAMIQMSAMFPGRCHYDRDANAPQASFNDLARHTWWQYAHYAARKHRLSLAQMLKQEQQAGRYGEVKKNGRKRLTFRIFVDKKAVILDLFPPRTGQIRALSTTGQWTVDLRPVVPTNCPSGRSLATRIAALERAKGTCKRCGENHVAHMHHTVPLRGKTFLARVMSDNAQRYTAMALCREGHLEVHGGSYVPRKRTG